MADYQKIILAGNATAAAVVKNPEDKTPYADFDLAVGRRGEGADYFPVRAFGKLAEDVVSRIEKGSHVLVDGRVEIDRFTPEDGEPRKTIRVVADQIRFL